MALEGEREWMDGRKDMGKFLNDERDPGRSSKKDANSTHSVPVYRCYCCSIHFLRRRVCVIIKPNFLVVYMYTVCCCVSNHVERAGHIDYNTYDDV